MEDDRDPIDPALLASRERLVLTECRRLRDCGGDYSQLDAAQIAKRLAWWKERGASLRLAGSLPRQAYTLLLIEYLGLREEGAPVVYEDERSIVWRSFNFCPTLEACIRLGLDTRVVCRESKERSAQALIARLDPRLRFSRDYGDRIRPYGSYCEERIDFIE